MPFVSGEQLRATGSDSCEGRAAEEMRADLGLTHLEDLTSSEIAQVANIGANTITAAQWGYVGGMDQGLATTDSVTFDGVTVADGGTLACGSLTVLETASDGLGFLGAGPVAQRTVADVSTSAYTVGTSPADMDALVADLSTQIDQIEADLESIAEKYNEALSALKELGLAF